jgi:hypothetical protein
MTKPQVCPTCAKGLMYTAAQLLMTNHPLPATAPRQKSTHARCFPPGTVMHVVNPDAPTRLRRSATGLLVLAMSLLPSTSQSAPPTAMCARSHPAPTEPPYCRARALTPLLTHEAAPHHQSAVTHHCCAPLLLAPSILFSYASTGNPLP